jgi:lysophospholipase L1-like esterase
MKNKLKKSVFWLFVLAVAAELVLRFGVGLGQEAIFVADGDYEYIYAPNLNVSRFGNTFQTNAESMRSKPLSERDKQRILKFGDSVANGGAHVDQKDVSSTLEEDALQVEFKDSIRVLNVSAASWGVDNAFAYLKKHGDFGASMIVLTFSSHDLQDNRHFQEVVGKHASWPSSQPLLALTDGWRKYAWPKFNALVSDSYEENYLRGISDSHMNTGWQNFIDYTSEKDIELLVYLHAEVPELLSGDYKSKGRRLLELLRNENVTVIEGLHAGLVEEDYRDHIHLVSSGHRKMHEAVLPYLSKHLQMQQATAQTTAQ